MSCLIPSLTPPDLYVSLRGVFSSTNPHLQLHTNDTNCQCNYVLICAVCVCGWCVLHTSLSGVINRCRAGFAHCTCAVWFCFGLFAKSLSEMLTDFKFCSRFISLFQIWTLTYCHYWLIFISHQITAEPWGDIIPCSFSHPDLIIINVNTNISSVMKPVFFSPCLYIELCHVPPPPVSWIMVQTQGDSFWKSFWTDANSSSFQPSTLIAETTAQRVRRPINMERVQFIQLLIRDTF